MDALAKLKRFYGDIASVEPRDPFASIVWENTGYLIDDARRRVVFQRLERQIGIDPVKLLEAGPQRIEGAIREDGGMRPQHRAAKVLRCAQLVLEFAGGDLLATLRGADPKAARVLLKRFPGIGDPGADKLMLLAGLSDLPALDSNGLRVLERLGTIRPSKSYVSSYRAGVAGLADRGVTGARARSAFEYLRHHGKHVCKRAAPQCSRCPLRAVCPYALNRLAGVEALTSRKMT